MALATFELVFLTISLLVPGYFIDLVLRTRRIRKSEESQIAFFRWLVLGTTAQLPWLLVALLALLPNASDEQDLREHIVNNGLIFSIVWFVAVFGWPFLVGWLFGNAEAAYLAQRRDGLMQRCVALLGNMVAIQGPVNDDSSWDTKFTSLENTQGEWILVELTNGDWVAGVFGRGSYASVNPYERDIYLADIRYTSLTGDYAGLSKPDGMLIQADQIRHIQFWE